MAASTAIQMRIAHAEQRAGGSQHPISQTQESGAPASADRVQQIEHVLLVNLGGHRNLGWIQIRKLARIPLARVTTPLTPAEMLSERS